MHILISKSKTMKLLVSFFTIVALAFSSPTIAFSSINSKSSTTALNMAESKAAPFKTWTFDRPCDTMEFSKVSSASISVTDKLSTVDESDLIILAIYGPKKDEEKEGDEDEDEKDEKEVPKPTLVGKSKEIDEQLEGALTDIMMENHKDFKHGVVVGAATPVIRFFDGNKVKKVMLIGLGSEGEDIAEGFGAKIGASLASQCDASKKVKTCCVVLPSASSMNTTHFADLSTEFYNTLYSDNRYRTGDNIQNKAEDLESITVVTEGDVIDAKAFNVAIQDGKNIASGVILAKDIVNAPHNVLNSESLANVARRIAEESGGTIKCIILGKEECEKRGMGSYLGVARGSETDPQFIHLTYTPKNGIVNKKVGVVGKGLLFDTGGYNIKVAMMELMKGDCGGAAAVLGAAQALGVLAPEGVEAHFIVAACENMINEKAMVPSNILTASNGKTIEVLNTDAEGRLTMADALVYADKEAGCESIIELSTLTGACMVSLGMEVCGIWTDDDDLAADLADISKVTGEKSWRMPLEKSYNKQLKSKIADMTNLGDRFGGAITAALFLQNFVSKKKPFAHIDIAGPAWSNEKGGTGFGAKMVAEWVSRQGKSD